MSLGAAQVLEGRWAPGEDELADDPAVVEDLRAILAPFGTRFPGLAPALEEELDPELMRRAAEHSAFSVEAYKALRGVCDIARAILNNPCWDSWWD